MSRPQRAKSDKFVTMADFANGKMQLLDQHLIEPSWGQSSGFAALTREV